MQEFFASVRDLCLFRRGPEEMPYAPRLLVATLTVYAALEIWFDLHNGAKSGLLTGVVFAGLAVLGVLFLLLRGRAKSERFVQTATSLAVVGVLFDAVVYPLTLWIPLKELLAHPLQPMQLTTGQTMVMLAISVLGIWKLCVWISTLRRALEVPLAGAVLVFLLLLFVNWIVLGLGTGLAGAA